ncbi:MAG: alanine racemase [Frankiaceae bacterium]
MTIAAPAPGMPGRSRMQPHPDADVEQPGRTNAEPSGRLRAEPSGRLRAEARIDLDAVRTSTAELVRRAGGAEVMAVVKADGYGHGMLPCAQAALKAGATWLGTSALEEGLALRAAGIDAPILSWLAAPGEPLAAGVAAGIDLSASAEWMLDELAGAAHQAGRAARVHLKADTGLHRAGALPGEWPALVAAALRREAAGEIDIVGLWSHFAWADAPGHPTIARQIQLFGEAVETAERAGVRAQVRHVANSAATLTLPAARFDLVRPGISVYGLSPGPDVGTARELGLVPAMTFRARVALAKHVPPGSGVSYGHRYVTAGETALALVPVGYADGVPRNAANKAEVLLGGRRRRIAGTVCMDQFVLDVGADEVVAGDDVVLFGPGTAGEPTAQEWAEALDTICYEVVSRIGMRVPRTYVGQATVGQATVGQATVEQAT